jgi:hypothetical protein
MDNMFTYWHVMDVPIILSSVLSRVLSFQGSTAGNFGTFFPILAVIHADLPLQSSALAGDWMQGLLLSVLVVGVFLAVSALRDYLVRVDMNHPDMLPERQHQQLPQQQVVPQVTFVITQLLALFVTVIKVSMGVTKICLLAVHDASWL